jgi:hypothetical protein
MLRDAFGDSCQDDRQSASSAAWAPDQAPRQTLPIRAPAAEEFRARLLRALEPLATCAGLPFASGCLCEMFYSLVHPDHSVERLVYRAQSVHLRSAVRGPGRHAELSEVAEHRERFVVRDELGANVPIVTDHPAHLSDVRDRPAVGLEECLTQEVPE